MRRLFLFLKAHQHGLFDEQVTVSGHATKTGTYVQSYQAKRKKRHDEPQAGDLFAEAAAPKSAEKKPETPAPKPKKEPTPEQAKRKGEKSPAAKYAQLTHIAEKFGFGRGYAENVYFKEFPKPNGKPGETYQIGIEQVSIDGKPAWKVSSSLKYVDGKGYKTAVPGESHIANSIDETRSRLNAIMDGIGIPRPREEDAAEKAPAPGLKKSATIAEPADELIGEHRRLVRVLRSPSHADDLKEADEQEAELREYERKAKRKKKVCKAFLVAPLHQLLKARAHA